MRWLGKIYRRVVAGGVVSVAIASCSVSRFIPEGDYLLDGAEVRTDTKELPSVQLQGYIQQHPNTRWLSFAKVPMLPWMISGRDTTKRINRFLHRVGQAPVIYDPVKASTTRQDVETAVRNMGYLSANVRVVERSKKKKMKVTYLVETHERYRVDQVYQHVNDSVIGALLNGTDSKSLLQKGIPFDVNLLEQERVRLNTLIRNHGYYRFNKDNIHFRADTTGGPDKVRLAAVIDAQGQQAYHIGNVNFRTDTIVGRKSIRENVLKAKTHLIPGQIYQDKKLQRTYNGLSTLGAVVSSNVQLEPAEDDSLKLDAMVSVLTAKPHTFDVELEGTNSAGDFGAAVSFGYRNRNIMRGSEVFGIKARGAYEAIRGLNGYEDQDYIEYGVEAALTFPDLKMPWVSRDFRRNITATSEVSLNYDSQDRPEFHRRVVTGAWRYRWHADDRRRQHRLDLIDLNYVFMPWISPTFKKDYLDNEESRNAILRYNYENLFIMKLGYMLTLSSQPLALNTGSYGTNAWNMRIGVESAGNLLYGITNLFNTAKNSEGYYQVFNIAYAQYVKGDFDFTKSFRLNNENSLAFHFGLGVAFPYGNATILPYEKRYFSGGANSVRGWSVRGLGPGRFRGRDGRIDFINQTGDIKLDMNLEYRTHLFWLIDGAVFVDAGNIWTARDYEAQPGGQFRFKSFWKEIAVAYGLGVRLNFNYFILRLDGGMKAVNPSYTDSFHHFPIIHPRFKRDFALHFAVGLPF
ncbi:MAG: BamA/TamA family outer membrane protein [Bacteroidaceae bacterium]|nr:BamA/TamA family outer membrane protein [Bacteroidaceae bacterium]